MEAQERLASRLERAKKLTQMKKEEEKHKSKPMLTMKSDKLKEAISKAAQLIAGTSAPITPNEAFTAQATAEAMAMKAKVEAETGISVPSYYNPLVINPVAYAQQQAKRKKLWSKKDTSEDSKQQRVNMPASSSTALWSKMSLGDDKSNEKFAKLMGMKDGMGNKNSNEIEDADIITKQRELFSNLDQQYQQARVTTHTQRGVGLGFSSMYVNPNTVAAEQANQQLGGTAPNTKN